MVLTVLVILSVLAMELPAILYVKDIGVLVMEILALIIAVHKHLVLVTVNVVVIHKECVQHIVFLKKLVVVMEFVTLMGVLIKYVI